MTGLARAFLYAGARAVIATQWRALDRAAELMPRVYEFWLGGSNLADSLRAAQIEMIQANRPPREWAPFVLIGKP